MEVVGAEQLSSYSPATHEDRLVDIQRDEGVQNPKYMNTPLILEAPLRRKVASSNET